MGGAQATAGPVSDTSEGRFRCFTITASDAVNSSEDDSTHVQPVMDRLPDSLTAEQRKQTIELIKRISDVFSRHEFNVGCTTVLTACIHTTHDRPIAEPFRRHARVYLDAIDKTIEKIREAGIVGECSSPWSANVVVVAKRDKAGNPVAPRNTIDYHGLNSHCGR